MEQDRLQVFEGQGLQPARPHPLSLLREEDEVAAYLASVREVIGNCVRAMPPHAVTPDRMRTQAI